MDKVLTLTMVTMMKLVTKKVHDRWERIGNFSSKIEFFLKKASNGNDSKQYMEMKQVSNELIRRPRTADEIISNLEDKMNLP